MRKVIVSLVLAAVMLIVPVVAFAGASQGSTYSRGSSSTTSANTVSNPATPGTLQGDTFVMPDGTTLKSNWAVVGKTWKYFGADGKMFKSTWAWIKGADGVTRCYYFGADGTCYLNCTTPDGYTVNANGEWTKGGVAQTK